MLVDRLEQVEMEIYFSKQSLEYEVFQILLKYLPKEEVKQATKALEAWIYEPCEQDKHERKMSLLGWNERDMALCMYMHIFTKPESSLQEFMGKFSNDLDVEDCELLAGEMLTVIAINSEQFDIQHRANKWKIIPRNNVLVMRVARAINRRKYTPPMLCPPRKVKANRHTGYLTQKGSIILGGKENHHEEKVSLDAINILNQIPLKLDMQVIEYEEIVEESETNFGKFLQKSFLDDCVKIYEKLLNRVFYFTWKFDKRGRLYSQGYHINLQSTDYKKASISFADQEVIKLT